VRRRALLAAALLASLEVAWTVLTGHGLVGHASPVSLPGFLVRLAVAGALWLAVAVTGSARLSATRVVLVAAFMLSLVQFQYVGPRVVGDGMMYYVYVRSLWKDGDLDFANEYGHYGLLRPDRGDLMTPTRTGLRRSIFSIGPAVLWTPFFLGGEAVARIEHLRDPTVDLSGYGGIHWNATAAGSLLYGFGALWLIVLFLRRHFGEAIAALTAMALLGATFLYWYMVHQPTYAHAPSVFLAALLVWLWDRQRGGLTPWRAFVWGLTLGLAMCVRWQNGVLALLPALELVRALRPGADDGRPWRAHLRPVALAGACLGAGALIGVFPQLVAWKVIFGEWLLAHPPHGAGFLRLDHPYLLETLFSSRHGLLAWTPVLWLGYLGFWPALRRRAALAVPLLIPLLVMSYVNMCAGDWWAGASFSNRRFDSCLPLFAFGIAAALEWLRGAVARRPLLATTLMLAPLALWNLGLLTARSGSSATWPGLFPKQVGEIARGVSRSVGSPTTWPASWIFALRYRVTPDRHDRLSGRYLFYRQNNLGGTIDLGEPDDTVMLGEGWGDAAREGERTVRPLNGKGRLFAPIDMPEAFGLRVQARATCGTPTLVVRINGSEVGRSTVDAEWRALAFATTRGSWRRELNDVVLATGDGGDCVVIDRVDFVREPR